ncbi:hypothetical protein E2C01_083722 [Portunus trituberculatus]|uniref:Uncharacterized protein n=1 Tax=Portunus trituberculatus TaxID=210409 RepID=A0A5B7IT71_PORTR|nr:hypothetical protein [Portunus trituberculatus]
MQADWQSQPHTPAASTTSTHKRLPAQSPHSPCWRLSADIPGVHHPLPGKESGNGSHHALHDR